MGRPGTSAAASDGAAYDYFGQSVGGSGDTAIVGAPGADPTGAAYVFTRGRSQATRLTAADAHVGDQFGSFVAMSGGTAVVSNFGADTRLGTDAGSAYVFTRTGTTWTQQAKLVAADGAAFDYFGGSVAVSGDTLVIGSSMGDPAAGPDAGSAYVFTRTGSRWTEQAKLTASDGVAFGYFGVAVDVSGDTAVVGASLRDTPAGVDAGLVYVFGRTGTTWTEQARLATSDGAAGDYFGQSVAVSAGTIVAGAYGDDTSAGINAGSAYVFTRAGSTWTQQAKLVAAGAVRSGFGTSVAVAGDTLVAGANGAAAYVFVRVGAGWTPLTTILAPASESFGTSVALGGGTVVLGAPGADTSAGTDAGAAFFFAR